MNNPKITLALSPDPRTPALIEGKVTVEGYELAISHGEAEYETKRELVAGAYCLLAPITWPEPFGLFMIEAMACGTPVIAFDRGAAPEVVRDRETGFIVDDVEEMVQAVDYAAQIDPFRCREHIERHFSVSRMANDYLRAYASMLSPLDDKNPPHLKARYIEEGDRSAFSPSFHRLNQ